MCYSLPDITQINKKYTILRRLQIDSVLIFAAFKKLNIETTKEEIDLDVQETVEIFMHSVELLDISSTDDQILISEHAIEIVEEKTDIQKSAVLFDKRDNMTITLLVHQKIFHHHLSGLYSGHRGKTKEKHEKLTAVVTSPQMII